MNSVDERNRSLDRSLAIKAAANIGKARLQPGQVGFIASLTLDGKSHGFYSSCEIIQRGGINGRNRRARRSEGVLEARRERLQCSVERSRIAVRRSAVQLGADFRKRGFKTTEIGLRAVGSDGGRAVEPVRYIPERGF